MYIRYSGESYQGDDNLREIINQSGEVLGTYDVLITNWFNPKTKKPENITVNKKDALKYNGVKTNTNIVLDENCMEVTESMITEPFDKKTLVLLDISNNRIIKKIDNQLKLEKLTKMQGFVLEKLKDVRGAISAQGETNKIKEKKGKAPIYVIPEDDIEIIGDYQNQVATFHQTWNPDDYTLEQIDDTIFNGGLVLPEIVTRLL